MKSRDWYDNAQRYNLTSREKVALERLRLNNITLHRVIELFDVKMFDVQYSFKEDNLDRVLRCKAHQYIDCGFVDPLIAEHLEFLRDQPQLDNSPASVPFEQHIKPPLGIMPKKFWELHRLSDLFDAIMRYNEAHIPVNPEWYEEYEELRFIYIEEDYPRLQYTIDPANIEDIAGYIAYTLKRRGDHD